MNVKPGWTTTEFWTTVASLVMSVAAVVAPTHDVSGPVKAIAAAAGPVAAAIYTITRGRVKAPPVVVASAPLIRSATTAGVPLTYVPPPGNETEGRALQT